MTKPKFNNRHNISITQDDKEYWISRSVATAGIIITKFKKEYYVLVGKRGKGAADYQGYYDLPCGYLDMDETGKECFIREVFEETGFYIPDIKKKRIIFPTTSQPFQVNTDPSANRQNVTLYYGFVFKSKKELPILSLEYNEPDEVEEAKWVNIKDYKKIGKYAYGHDERIYDYIHFIDSKIHHFNILEKIIFYFKLFI